MIKKLDEHNGKKGPWHIKILLNVISRPLQSLWYFSLLKLQWWSTGDITILSSKENLQKAITWFSANSCVSCSRLHWSALKWLASAWLVPSRLVSAVLVSARYTQVYLYINRTTAVTFIIMNHYSNTSKSFKRMKYTVCWWIHRSTHTNLIQNRNSVVDY